MRLQPGILRVLETLPEETRLLDLGCGNGELARELARRGHRGTYVGLDFSLDLLEVARNRFRREGLAVSADDQAGIPPINHRSTDAPETLEVFFIQADLSTREWDIVLPTHYYDVILAFALLHHLPGDDLRRQVLDKVRAHLDSNGHFVHSEWQFLNSPRLRGRIQPWETIGLTSADVDPGDYLLDWRRGGYGLRYVHHFDKENLARMAQETGFFVEETFLSDGEGGKLGLYQIWSISPNTR